MKQKIYSKIKIPKQKTLKKELDELWTECIKTKAGYKSELSKKEGKKIGGDIIITAHHIAGKSNNRLRYELDNGICLDNIKEHIYGVHNRNPQISRIFQDRIIEKIGQEKYDWLCSLKYEKTKFDLKLVKIYLEEKLKEFRK